MTEKKSEEAKELEEGLRELKKIQKGNTSKEVIEAILDKINEEENTERERVARSKNDREIQPQI